MLLGRVLEVETPDPVVVAVDDVEQVAHALRRHHGVALVARQPGLDQLVDVAGQLHQDRGDRAAATLAERVGFGVQHVPDARDRLAAHGPVLGKLGQQVAHLGDLLGHDRAVRERRDVH